MIKLGITGGIGSGKSVVGELLSLYGVPVFIADTEAKILTNTSTEIRTELIKLFGDDLYTETGLDKNKLASYIFSNQKLLQTVNRIIHPEVGRSFRSWVDRQKGGICAIESAILFESGFDALVDKTLSVYAPEEIRIRRVAGRDRISEETIRQRMKNQISEEIKKERSDFVIYNDDHTALIPQVHTVLSSLNQ